MQYVYELAILLRTQVVAGNELRIGDVIVSRKYSVEPGSPSAVWQIHSKEIGTNGVTFADRWNQHSLHNATADESYEIVDRTALKQEVEA